MPVSNAKLLIVEDDPAVRASLERRFRFEGFQVTVAERGEQDAAHIERTNYISLYKISKWLNKVIKPISKK